MKIITIVAVDNNWGIGKNNKLLYNIPTDMKFFRETTTNQIVVYGLNTLKSFPKEKPLPNRINIVLSFENIEKENLIVAKSIEELMEILKEYENDDKDVFICGGASIYKQMIDMCDEAYITKIDATTEGTDTFFPNLDEKENWEINKEQTSIIDKSSGLKITFCTYTNKNKQQIS